MHANVFQKLSIPEKFQLATTDKSYTSQVIQIFEGSCFSGLVSGRLAGTSSKTKNLKKSRSIDFNSKFSFNLKRNCFT